MERWIRRCGDGRYAVFERRAYFVGWIFMGRFTWDELSQEDREWLKG